MSNPKISVIVPVYNAEKYLSRCIDSIIAQTFIDFELLLINDGSKDDSGDICDKYAIKDKRVKVFHKKNGGVSSARNFGIEKSIGTYISFVDSDDEVVSSYLKTLYDNIIKSDIVFFSSVWYYEDGCESIITSGEYYSCKRKEIESALFHLMKNETKHNLLGFTWNKIFKSDIIKKHNIKFVENLSISEDEIFTLDYCQYIDSLCIIKNPLYYYYRKKDGLTYKIRKDTEWYLLCEKFVHVLCGYENLDLKKYIYQRVRTYLLKTVDNMAFVNIKLYYNVFYILHFCKIHDIKISILTIIKRILYVK